MNVQKRKKGVEVEKEVSVWSKAFSSGSNWEDKVCFKYCIKSLLFCSLLHISHHFTMICHTCLEIY